MTSFCELCEEISSVVGCRFNFAFCAKALLQLWRMPFAGEQTEAADRRCAFNWQGFNQRRRLGRPSTRLAFCKRRKPERPLTGPDPAFVPPLFLSLFLALSLTLSPILPQIVLICMFWLRLFVGLWRNLHSLKNVRGIREPASVPSNGHFSDA